MKKIVLTGGGTAGHVLPHFALLPHFEQKGWEVHYVGTHTGIERELVGERLPYHPISAGKFRRYFDLKNFSDPFRVLKGVFDAYGILRRIGPQVVFGKGGFVTVPVAVAARFLGIPVVLHESDLTPGLANRLSLPFASHLCLTFPDAQKSLGNKATVTGTPIRPELTQGSRLRGHQICQFKSTDPVLLVMGGSLGSAFLNSVIRDNLAALTKNYQVIHLCGAGNLDKTLASTRYCQWEFVHRELPDLLAAADLVVSRAGANAIFELVALAKPNILVPLSRLASRGDQILNAQSFAKQGFSIVIQEEELNYGVLTDKLNYLVSNPSQFVQKMSASGLADGTNNVLKIINRFAK